MTEVKDILREITDNVSPRIIGGEVEAPIAIIPMNMKVESLKKYNDEVLNAPERRKGTASLDSADSFSALVNRFKDRDSAIFAHAVIDNNQASLTALLDYHPAGDDNGKARFCGHRAVYSFPASKEFIAWNEKNGTVMKQGEFAAFIEDHLPDISSPKPEDRTGLEIFTPKFAEPLEMLELSRGLEVRANETVQAVVKLQSGEAQMQFTSQHVKTDGGALDIPGFFVIEIPVFEGEEKRRIPVRLRYRKAEATLMWFYDLYRPQDVFDAAFRSVCDKVVKATELPLFLGKPET